MITSNYIFNLLVSDAWLADPGVIRGETSARQAQSLREDLPEDKAGVLPEGGRGGSRPAPGTPSPMQIARRLKINFSTAKTLLRNYRPAPEADPQLVDSLCAEF